MNASWEAIELRMQERGVGTLKLLAENSGVSVKSLTRIKKGEASNATTLERVAKALRVETADLLQPPDKARRREALKTLEKQGYKYLNVLTDRSTRLAIRLTCARYDISFSTLTKLGPLFAVTIFEKWLALRRARLAAFNEAFEAALATAPDYLEPARYTRGDVENANAVEEDSIAANDVTGAKLEDDTGWFNEKNLFAEFLREFTSELEPGLIHIQHAWGPSLDNINFLLLENDLLDLTNGDRRALFALENEYARAKDMPDDARSAADAAVRAAWLAERVPNEIWEAEERRFSEIEL